MTRAEQQAFADLSRIRKSVEHMAVLMEYKVLADTLRDWPIHGPFPPERLRARRRQLQGELWPDA